MTTPTHSSTGSRSDAAIDVESDRLSGLVLLDLPDFDSVETAHRLEVNRIVELADLLVWVVEPQKYADAALHGGYLRPLATHGGSMAVVLNQIDQLATNETDALQHDTARLLAQDGLIGTPVLAISARTGAGLDELRELLARRVASRRGRHGTTLRGRRGRGGLPPPLVRATPAPRSSSHATGRCS